MTHEGTSWLEVELQSGSSIWYPVIISTPDPTAVIAQRFAAPEANRTVETITAHGRVARIVRVWPDGAREALGARA